MVGMVGVLVLLYLRALNPDLVKWPPEFKVYSRFSGGPFLFSLLDSHVSFTARLPTFFISSFLLSPLSFLLSQADREPIATIPYCNCSPLLKPL